MKVAVLIKSVPDTASVIKIGSDGKNIETDGLKYVLNPYDEHAVEEAVKLKGAGGTEVIIVSAGGDESKEAIRVGLAMGGDYGVLVKDPAIANARSRGISKVLAAALKTLSPDLVFAGKQAVDDDASQVPERVAEILGFPHASSIIKFEASEGKVVVNREVEGGHYVVELPLPALLTTQKALNKPRYPSLPNIMKAKKKEIKELDLQGIGLSASDLSAGITVLGLDTPKIEKKNKVLEGDNQQRVKELVNILHQEEKTI